mgnify:CR=1 FL=1
MVKPFKVNISDQIIKDIYDKVKKYPWHEMPNDGGWKYGANLDYMKEISKYWVSEFDWRKYEREINKFPNFITKVDDIDIHFIHEKGSGSKPMPLLISHGWPGTIVEFLHIIEKLAHPERFDGKEEDAFDVIAPSLPGFGFSGRPSRPIGPRKMADIFNNLMTKKLGYKNYLAQGGDWGGAITTWLGYDHPKTCNAIHLNIFTNFRSYVRKYFKDSRLIRLMEFPVLFLGATPQNTPALYSLMNYTGLYQGTYYPIGGFNEVIQGLVALANEKGVKIKTNSVVKEVIVKNSKAKGLKVNDTIHLFDAVVAGADYHHVEQKMLPENLRNYSKKYWENREMAPSSLLFYIGVDKKLENVNHHTLFFDEDFDEHAKEIYDNPSWPKSPLFYMSCASITDDTIAPKGMENLMILIPLAPGLDDSEKMREHYFQIVLKRIKDLTGNDIENNIIIKKSYCKFKTRRNRI